MTSGPLVNVKGVNRIMPVAPVAAYQTYQILAPVSTHFRPATCAEVHCLHYEQGWKTIVDEATELGQRQAGYIRHQSGRAYTEGRVEGGLTTFVFPPGQACFRSSEHRVSLEREPIFRVKAGDWRRNLGEIRRHTTAEDWRDDFGEHQERIVDKINEG